MDTAKLDAVELTELVKKANGKRRNRIISPADIALFLETFEENKDKPEVKNIRVYPARDPFVANYYSHRADVVCLHAHRNDESGLWSWSVLTVDAHRKLGTGSNVNINNRGA
jgi:hypothetical protein